MEKQWKQLLEKLMHAGDDFRKETQRMVEDLRDPKKQDKVMETLRDLGTWAKGTAEEATRRLETAVSKLEETVHRASDKMTETLTGSAKPAAKKKKAPRKTATKKRAAPSAAKSRRQKKTTS